MRALLLPERRRFAGQAPSTAVARLLGRADRLPDAEPGERAQLLRHFQLTPRGWPMAAITRQFEAGDGEASAWLRVDPVHVRADMRGVRMLAWGNLGLDEDEAGEFLRALRPLFGDAGMPISHRHPERWYLQLARDTGLPDFVTPVDALGRDLLELLPAGADGARWRALLNEAQVMLHNHPANARRLARGQLPANSVWFWGGGRLPAQVTAKAARVASADVEVQALAALAGATLETGAEAAALIDLRQERDWRRVERDVLLPLASSPGGEALWLDFADGRGYRLARSHRWRIWRKPLRQLDA